MYIKKLFVENVRSFPGEQEFTFRPGVNYIVGDNNCGKSTVFEAILYLTGKLKNTEHFQSTQVTEPFRVVAVIAGDDLKVLLNEAKFQKYQPYLYVDEDGDSVVKVERSNAERTVMQSGKSISLDGRKICFWNHQEKQFENPTGIDALFKALLECEPIWADASPSDYADMSSTKTLGRLVSEVSTQFFGTSQWAKFSSAHAEAFSTDGDESLGKLTAGLAAEIQKIVEQQYGTATVKFDFDLPEPVSFVKAGQLVVDDGAGETPLTEKGTGMQRAFALAVIQLYAKSLLAADGITRPLVLLLDEPETWLHPRAQLKLADALSSIAGAHQLFLITHSPYLLRKFDSESHQLVVFKGRGEDRQIQYGHFMGLVGEGEPSWGEINYIAFGIASHELHNELYGEFQRLQGMELNGKELDALFVAQGVAQDRVWQRSGTLKYNVTLPVYVRNSIHHPENTLNSPFTDQDLIHSTELLIGALTSAAS